MDFFDILSLLGGLAMFLYGNRLRSSLRWKYNILPGKRSGGL